MPTVKPTAKTNEKPTSKGAKEASAKEAKEKAAKEAEKAARSKVIEGLVPQCVKILTKAKDFSDKANASMLESAAKFRELRDENELTKDECRLLIKSTLAKVYCDGDIEQVSVSGNATANSMLSRYVRICFPDTEKNKKAESNVAKALDDGDVTFFGVYDLAKGADPKKAQKKGKHGGARKPGGNSIDSADEFGNQVGALIGRAWDGNEGEIKGYEGGCSLDELEEQFATVMAGFREKESGAEEAK